MSVRNVPKRKSGKRNVKSGKALKESKQETINSGKIKSGESRTVLDVSGRQPEINIGLVGHVDHGKTTLVSKLSGKWTDTHSEELKRGITIRLGYSNSIFYKCKNCKEPESYGFNKICNVCGKQAELLRKVSFVDAPGHETLMATMLCGAAIIDGAILLIAANEHCPQPQTKEHLMALSIVGVKNIIIAQNKVDLVSEEKAMENYEQIKAFVNGSIAEDAPIIPISAQREVNLDILTEAIEDFLKTPKRNLDKPPLMFVARSFDINLPGCELDSLVGGVVGGALKQGVLRKGDKIEIRPGRVISNKDGRKMWKSITSEIANIKSGRDDLEQVQPGGSIAVLTMLDPSIVKSDQLVGNVVGIKGEMPDVIYECDLGVELLERVVGAKDELVVESIKRGEALMLNVNSAVTVGIVSGIGKGKGHVRLNIPVCANKGDRMTISRRLGARWRLIGFGVIE